MINGIPQSFGQNYKATDVVCQPKKRFFSANIATAYPKEAEVNSWTRAYSLGDKQLTITDNFSLKSAKEPNQVNFPHLGKGGYFRARKGDDRRTGTESNFWNIPVSSQQPLKQSICLIHVFPMFGERRFTVLS